MTETKRVINTDELANSDDIKNNKKIGRTWAVDPYVVGFARSVKEKNVFVIRGSNTASKNKIQASWKENKTFYYIDNGYLQPGKKKEYHRIVKNNLQNIGDIVDRPTDRLIKLNWKYQNPVSGDYILIVPPSKKVMGIYNADYDSWMEETMDKIKTVTNLPVKVRHKPSRSERVNNNPLWRDLKNAKCLVTYNSIAASEAMFYSKPAVALAPNAATSLCNSSLDDIPKNLYVPTKEEITKFIAHLSYCQFTQKEMDSGFAWKIINEGS